MIGLELDHILQSGGIALVAAIVFAESGLLIGFFLPGDSLLFSAGFLAAQGHMNLPILLIAVVVAAILGDNVGYQIGRRSGKRLFHKQDSLLFHKDHIMRAEKFYERHGGKTIIMARFIPVVRTFAPMVAGVGNMPYERFFFFNVIGGVTWGAGITLLGYWLGNRIPNIDKFIMPVILLIMAFSVGSAIYHIVKEPGNRRRILRGLKQRLPAPMKKYVRVPSAETDR
jgi:membrane-associated protein